MRRSMLAVTALVALVAAACSDDPISPNLALDDAAATNPDAALTSHDLTTLRDLLDDPFVLLLVDSQDGGGTEMPLQASFLDLSHAVIAGNTYDMHEALTEAQTEVQTDGDADGALVRAALGLVFDHAEAVLDNRRADREQFAENLEENH